MVSGIDWTWLLNATATVTRDVYSVVHDYVDVHYMQWLAWVVYPLVLTIIMPFCIVLFLFASALFLHLYQLRHYIMVAIRDAVDRGDFWDGARYMIALLWDFQGRVWHGYEVVGLENIPTDGPALIIYYHGAIPIDLYYLMAKALFYRKREIRAVGDKFLFKIPGFKLLMEVFNVIPGTVSRGVDLMKEGHLLAIAPGGTREAYFSDEYYNLIWGTRIGFAKIATDAKVPVIPVFTQNCREAYRAASLGRRTWLRRLYEKTRLPVIPIYGGFPIKMRTFVGEPIKYDPNVTPEGLAEKVQQAIEGLILQHQKTPGNILRALTERVYTPHRKDS